MRRNPNMVAATCETIERYTDDTHIVTELFPPQSLCQALVNIQNGLKNINGGISNMWSYTMHKKEKETFIIVDEEGKEYFITEFVLSSSLKQLSTSEGHQVIALGGNQYEIGIPGKANILAMRKQ